MLIIDSREAKESKEHHNLDLKQYFTLQGISTTIELMDAGDFSFLDYNQEAETIERCETGNLIQKLHSKELENQLSRCASQYSRVILLHEGVTDDVSGLLATYKQGEKSYYRTRIYPTTKYNEVVGLLTRLSRYGIEIMHSSNFMCSLSMVKCIYEQRTKPDTDSTLFRSSKLNIPVKLSNNPNVPKLMALCSRLPEKVAIRLINRYGCIWGILQAPDKELDEIEGFGNTLRKRLEESIYGSK